MSQYPVGTWTWNENEHGAVEINVHSHEVTVAVSQSDLERMLDLTKAIQRVRLSQREGNT